MSNLYEISKRESKRQCTPWRINDYDDERTLLQIRRAHPTATWKDIANILNETVPENRKRTIDSITSKWQALKLTEGRIPVNSVDKTAEARA